MAYSKISTLESGLKKLSIRIPGSPDTCGPEVVSGRKKLRIQKYPDMYGRPGPESPTELSAVPYHLNYETIS